MSLVLTWGARIPTVRIGRVAGQYGKPRSSPVETVNGEEIKSFKGDNINGFEATAESREHDPNRLVEAHFHSACTLNYLRALIQAGYADLHHAKHWDLGYVQDSSRREEYEGIATRIIDSLDFMEACGQPQADVLNRVDFFTSHEGLVLDYESAVTKDFSNAHYNTGAHFLWIGDRTRQLDAAHIEYFRGITNPIGCKVGPSMKPQELIDLITTLDPKNTPGKVTLISRMGVEKVDTLLPPLVRAVSEAGLKVVWICDPMHGNTHQTADKIKTRSFDAVLEEFMKTFEIHAKNGMYRLLSLSLSLSFSYTLSVFVIAPFSSLSPLFLFHFLPLSHPPLSLSFHLSNHHPPLPSQSTNNQQTNRLQTRWCPL